MYVNASMTEGKQYAVRCPHTGEMLDLVFAVDTVVEKLSGSVVASARGSAPPRVPDASPAG